MNSKTAKRIARAARVAISAAQAATSKRYVRACHPAGVPSRYALWNVTREADEHRRRWNAARDARRGKRAAAP